MSPSARKVWIEIRQAVVDLVESWGHLPQGRCGLKSSYCPRKTLVVMSPSARKVWIEITLSGIFIKPSYVTFRKEGVD